MPGIKVADIAFVRLQSPSLEEAEQFLADFGLVRSEIAGNALYMRGTGGHSAAVNGDRRSLRRSSSTRLIDRANEPTLCGRAVPPGEFPRTAVGLSSLHVGFGVMRPLIFCPSTDLEADSRFT